MSRSKPDVTVAEMLRILAAIPIESPECFQNPSVCVDLRKVVFYARLHLHADSLDLKEALDCLDLIAAEWKSDFTSTRCFDSRIIERVQTLLKMKGRA